MGGNGLQNYAFREEKMTKWWRDIHGKMERQRENDTEGRQAWLLLPRPTASQPQTYKQATKYEKHPNILNVFSSVFIKVSLCIHWGWYTHKHAPIMWGYDQNNHCQSYINDTKYTYKKRKRFPLILDQGKKCYGEETQRVKDTHWEIRGQRAICIWF